jgi:hypothetical protein
VRRAFATLVMVATLGVAIEAQPAASSRQPSGNGQLQVWLITFGEGELYWEKFGHNALWFRDSTRRIDAAYNWGMFDFQSPDFLPRLLLGDNRYWVEAFPGTGLIEAYRQRDRTVVVQRLNLTAEQAARAFRLSQVNALEANKYYRYDYFRDNCSTRVRDMIDAVLDGALKAATAGTPSRHTYRSETLRLVDDLKLTQFGIDVALGRPADRELTIWENAFVPSRLRDAVREVRVRPDSTSPAVPLVAEERTLYESGTHSERETTPTLWPAYLAIGLLLAVMIVGIDAISVKSGRPAFEKALRFEAGAWSLIVGALGLIVALAWLITKHVFWYFNDNLLLLNPLSLFLVVLAPLSFWRARYTRPAAILAAIVVLTSAIGLIVYAVPSLRQDNLPLLLLFLPPHLAIAHAFWRRAMAQRPA